MTGAGQQGQAFVAALTDGCERRPLGTGNRHLLNSATLIREDWYPSPIRFIMYSP